jgi:hypothetical protein
MYSSTTNNQEARNNMHGDDAMTCEFQEQERATLNVETNTVASFTHQSRPSTSSGFIVPVSVLPAVETSVHIASASYRESDIPSGINDLVSEAHPIN